MQTATSSCVCDPGQPDAPLLAFLLRAGRLAGFAGTITLSVGGVLGGHLAHNLRSSHADQSAAAR